MADKELSADDLREKLFHTFQSRGVLESLKSQLRNRLVTELQQTAKANLANGKKKTPEEPLLFYHAANSLVVDHLEKCNFDYTLSVFLPESGMSKDKIYSVKDLLHLLNVDRDSYLYKSLESSLSNKITSKSFLWEIVSQFSALCGHSKQSSAVQTDECDSIKSPSVAEKLKFVERAFSGKADRDSEAWSVQSEQKIIDFQKKCEERKKAELAGEIQRFKASELSRMRLEEKEQCQKAIKMAKEQMEKDYILKAETLRLKEKELTEREDRHKKIQEEEAYAQRQKILGDIQAMKERENDLKRRQDLQERSLQLEEERVKANTEKLKEKEKALKEEETRVKQKIEDEIQRYKLQHQENYQKRLHDLELREVQFRQDKESFDRSKTLYLGYYNELESKKEQLRQFQSQLEVSKYNITSLQQQKNDLLQRLEQVKDYGNIKANEHALQIEKFELQRLVDEEKNKEKGYKSTIKELKDKLSKPSAELVSVQTNLKTAKEDAKNKEKLSKDMQKRLETRLQQENHRCMEYQRLYEEGLLRQKEMEREAEDLRAALHHTQSLLRMELERRRFSEASVTDVSLSSPPAEETLVKTDEPGRTRQHSNKDIIMNDTGTTQELIANSKEVFDKLEKDAKNLEESYRRFQSRMKNTGLDQFTSVHPISLDKNNAPNYTAMHAEAPTGSIQDKANTQEHFVPLSWVPASDNKGPDVPISYIASGHVGSSALDPIQSLKSLTREDHSNTESGTRFYSLPSFGVSALTQNTPAPRYFGLSTNTRRPPNNTVNVSDLIAKPGSPSVISAPIDHSSVPTISSQTHQTKFPNDKLGYSSDEATRRPLSSTIDRGNEGTGASRDTGFLTSSNFQGNSVQASHLPVIDGSVFRGRKSDTESENDSHRSSDASLSGDYLSMGTLNKPAKTCNSDQRKQQLDSQNDKKNEPNVPISLDDAWGGARNGKPPMETEQSIGANSERSMKSDHSIPEQMERPTITLDSMWKSKPSKIDENLDREREKNSREWEERDREQREARERKERERAQREREEREWEEEKRKREELRIRREEEAWEREQRELAELQRQQELDESKTLVGLDHHRADEIEKKDESPRQEDKKLDPDIDPVMLQYMQMIQKKKEDEQAKAAEPNKDKTSKEAAEALSNSTFSQGDEGSLDDLSGDNGFDWG